MRSSTDRVRPWTSPDAKVLTQAFRNADVKGALEFRQAPVYTTSALELLDEDDELPFTRLLGSVRTSTSVDECLWLNCNVPQSTVVCGVQGSGKSYTTSVLLENCLVNDRRIGDKPEPCSTLVLHYDRDSSIYRLPCEAAYLSSKIPVLVLVSSSNLPIMRHVYSGMKNVKILPLLFDDSDLSFDVMSKLMELQEGGEKPLYISVMQSLLQEAHAESEGGVLDFLRFIAMLEAIEESDPQRPSRNNKLKLNRSQKEMLNQRLRLLKSMSLTQHAHRRSLGYQSILDLEEARGSWFRPGQLTIVDLSDPFIDSSYACTLFEILLTMFQSRKIPGPKVLCLDEAHKYIGETLTPSPLTESVLHAVRLQRHNGMRIILSTQEPMIVPRAVLDLSTNIIVHRFSSPAWIEHLARHICTEDGIARLFDMITKLDDGEALVFSPTGLMNWKGQASKMGRSFAFTKIRKRVTADGGNSVMATK